MTKKTFLEELEKRLSILKEEEKQDILLEYKGIIEEKVQHGMKEKDAVADFGDFDEFVGEILSAYKINPHHDENEKKKEESFLEKGEDFIQKSAKKLSEITETIVTNIRESNCEITTTLIFEILLKAIVVLLIMGFLTLPFLLFSRIGTSILDFVLFPLNFILQFVWKLIVSILYFVTCAALVITMFKGYIRKPEENTQKQKVSPKKKKEENKKEEKKEDVKMVPKNKNTVSSLITILLKLFIICFFLFPIWIVILCGFLFLAILFYFLLQGISIWGPIICTISFLTFLCLLSRILYSGIFHNVRIRLYPFLITLVFGLIGAVMTFDFFTNLEYIDRIPKLASHTKQYTVFFQDDLILDTPFVLKIDDMVADNQVLLEVTYYPKYVNIEKEERIDVNNKNTHVSIETYGDLSAGYKLALQNLKNNKVYQYDDLEKISIVVKANSKMQKRIYSSH